MKETERRISSVDEGLFVDVNGVEQWVTERGNHRENPAILLVSGPGAALSAMTPLFVPWEKEFTLVQWDQPGAGATFAKNGAPDPFTFDRIARDGLRVVELVRDRLGVDKVVLLGISGGTIPALHMIRRRPDLFSAYVGTGQVVRWARQEALCYAMILDRARAAGDAAAVAELERIGPPPYSDVASDVVKGRFANAPTPAEQAAFTSLDPAVMAAVREPPADARWVARGLPGHDVYAVATAAFAALKAEMAAFDARGLGTRFDVPMFFFQGELDAHTVTSEVLDYAAEVEAPRKVIEIIPGAGHSAVFMRDAFLALLARHVRPVAAGHSPMTKS